MPDDRPRPFSWYEYLPWLHLGRTLRAALSIRVLVAAMIGYLGMKAGWRLIGMLFEKADNPHLVAHIETVKPWPRPLVGPGVLPNTQVGNMVEMITAPLLQGWYGMTQPFHAMFDHQMGWTGFAYAILCALWMLAIWSFFGGVITRSAAMRFTRDETPSLGHCIQFTNRRWSSYFVAPLFPLLGIVLAAIPLVLLGLLARSDVGSIVSGVFGFMILLSGLFSAILFVALTVGWPLMWATISTEGTDSFDALSRMYAYVYQRPMKLFFYLLVAGVLGSIGFLFVALLTGAVTTLGSWGIALGSGSERFDQLVPQYYDADAAELTGAVAAGSNLMQFWFGIVTIIRTSFPIAFLWCAFCGIYVLLRRDVDGAELDEIYLDDQQATYGLPHLATDAQGVPLATDATETPAAEEEKPASESDESKADSANDETNGDTDKPL